MKQTKAIHHIIIGVALLTLAGCKGDKPVRQLPHLGDTPYQEDSVLVTYATNPKRALNLLDSASLLGNISDYRGQFIRAKIYSKSLMEQQQDSAILILKSLLNHDSVRNSATEQENIYDMLIATSRVKHDLEAYLHWATKKAELCQQEGMETERWRTEADIGYLMTRLGQIDEGLQKLDDAISRLDAPGSIDRMDAFVVACKRKINALNDLKRFTDVIPLAQRILDRLDHYEQHADDYAEDSYRLSWSDTPNDRDRYLDFSRAQAWAFLAQAYSETLPQPLPVREGSSYSQDKDSAGESLFNSIDSAIRTEHLYVNVNLQRQDICDRFNISRHVLNDLLATHANGLSFPQYVNNIRIEEALRLLHDEPSKNLSTIANEVGFTPANLREQFKRKYGITPAEYRQNL